MLQLTSSGECDISIMRVCKIKFKNFLLLFIILEIQHFYFPRIGQFFFLQNRYIFIKNGIMWHA